MVQSATVLLALRGYEGTSFASVIAHAHAPRGSVYYHFPGGKDELIAAAIRRTVADRIAILESSRGDGVEDVLTRFADSWRSILERSGCEAGCPLVAVSNGAAPSSELLSVVAHGFEQIEEQLSSVLGHSPDLNAGIDVRSMAAFLLGAMEGAVAVGRAQRSVLAFDRVATPAAEHARCTLKA